MKTLFPSVLQQNEFGFITSHESIRFITCITAAIQKGDENKNDSKQTRWIHVATFLKTPTKNAKELALAHATSLLRVFQNQSQSYASFSNSDFSIANTSIPVTVYKYLKIKNFIFPIL